MTYSRIRSHSHEHRVKEYAGTASTAASRTHEIGSRRLMVTQEPPRISVIGLGGTIARKKGASAVRDRIDELVRHVPTGFARLEPIDFRAVGSSALSLQDLCDLAHLVRSATEDGADGIVVVQGTDTMEESISALATMLPPTVPIVMTGAMRLRDQPGSDATANVTDAIRVAADPHAAALGPVVVMAGEVHVARWVRKVDTHSLHALQSPGFGPVGSIVEGASRLWARPLIADHLGLPRELAARVDVVDLHLGADDHLLAAAAERSDGIILSAMGGGHVPPSVMQTVQAIAERGQPIVYASRTLGVPVLEHTYVGPGSESDLRSHGVVPAGMLTPSKARVRLAVALALGTRPADAFAV